MTESFTFWLIFGVLIAGVLALDLGVFHKKSHVVTTKEALAWTIVWATLAAVFGGYVYHRAGPSHGMDFFTGYLVELSLSADNVFVFAIIFTSFAVPKHLQHKVLFWGVLSAIVMRLIMVWVGAELIARFAWIIYVFGAFLILTGLKILVMKPKEQHPERNWVVRWFRRVVPTTQNYEGNRFLVRRAGKWFATPLLVVLVCVEVTDVIFALDSIPAIFGITTDPFIVFTSNIFAILGLRSLYFLLAGVMEKFYLLRPGLGIILAFVGIKMTLSHTSMKIDSSVALLVVAGILAASIVGSLVFPKSVPSAVKLPPNVSV